MFPQYSGAILYLGSTSILRNGDWASGSQRSTMLCTGVYMASTILRNSSPSSSLSPRPSFSSSPVPLQPMLSGSDPLLSHAHCALRYPLNIRTIRHAAAVSTIETLPSVSAAATYWYEGDGEKERAYSKALPLVKSLYTKKQRKP